MKAIQKAVTYDIAAEGFDGQGRGKDPGKASGAQCGVPGIC